MVGFIPLIERCLYHLRILPSGLKIPTSTVELISNLKESLTKKISACSLTRKYLHLLSRPAQPIKELEPDFQEVYMGPQRRLTPEEKEKKQLQGLKKKVKSEQKAAERELRLDTMYKARLQSQQRKDIQQEKSDKWKEILTFLEKQQHEQKTLSNNKNKKRKTAF
eukprot:TRINITY_DN78_c0_g2_i3.p1 TRINITY_DN78_c0_g2~~TRINITY_DN78_c0_g2_i3.p1  ORF type:complete len:165 (-),score=47.60 TRINITY_DN78_c0_g2_i3:90-584(-)